MSGVVDMITGSSGDAAADASIQAANIAAAGQTEALDYLKETEALPQQFREGALGQLAGLFGLEGGTGDPDAFMQMAMNSPLYKQLMANQSQGEEAIMRNAAATGGLRSGNVQGNLADYNTRYTNEALTQAYNQQLGGLQGLAGLPSNANAIAQMTAAPGMTQAQGITAGAQSQLMADQSLTNNLFGLGAALAFSDIRLKKDIKYKGEWNGHSIYSWTWRDNDLGLVGEDEGVMAHEIFEYMPDAIVVQDGILMVDYSKLEIQ